MVSALIFIVFMLLMFSLLLLVCADILSYVFVSLFVYAKKIVASALSHCLMRTCLVTRRSSVTTAVLLCKHKEFVCNSIPCLVRLMTQIHRF